MGEVVNFPNKQSHISGEAFCVQCGHTWVAVAPTGVFELECPQCRTMKGLFKYPCEPAVGALWTCNCGCDVFRITREETICYKCGSAQYGFDKI